MLSKIMKMSKPVFGIAIAIILWQAMSLSGRVVSFAQSAEITTGIADAKVPQSNGSDEKFDYNVALKDMTGNTLTFSQFKGKVIFLNLWATWCGPCRTEMPTIQQLYEQVANDNIVFVMLSLDKDQDREKIAGYIRKKSYSFPVYQPLGHLSRQLSVPSIPTTFVISKEGKIVAKEIGATNFNTKKFRNFLETEASR
jgi:thiol-disulfide isomerase/thioredoxin